MTISTSQFHNDSGRLPIDRILAEEPIHQNRYIHVVRDREPIAQSHHLVVSRIDAASIADLSALNGEVPDFDELAAMLMITEWCYFERGRAPFCTSMLTASHAHAHIFESGDFSKDFIRWLASELGATEYASLASAMQALSRRTDQYLLFGSREDLWFVVHEPNACFHEKRFVRKYLTSHRVS